MVKEGLINLDFADVRAVMREMGKAMMGTGEASGEKRALAAAEAAISNPLIDDASMKGAKGLLISITGGKRPHAVRGRRGRDPHPRGGRSGRQHHRRRDLRREPRRHHPRVGGGDRHRLRPHGSNAAAGHADDRAGSAARRTHAEAARRPAAAAERVERGETPRSRPHPAPQPRLARQRPTHGGDRIGGQGRGRRSAAADHGDRGGDHPADPAEAVAVPGADVSRAAGERAATGAAFIPPAPERPASRGRACRGSTNCRCRRRTSCARSVVSRERRSIRRSAGSVCCSGSHRSVSARSARGGAKPADRVRPAPGDPAAAPTGPCRRVPRPAPGRPSQRAGAGLRIRQAARPPGLDPLGRQAPVHNSPEEDQLDIPAFLRRQAN